MIGPTVEVVPLHIRRSLFTTDIDAIAADARPHAVGGVAGEINHVVDHAVARSLLGRGCPTEQQRSRGRGLGGLGGCRAALTLAAAPLGGRRAGDQGIEVNVRPTVLARRAAPARATKHAHPLREQDGRQQE